MAFYAAAAGEKALLSVELNTGENPKVQNPLSPQKIPKTHSTSEGF